MKLFITEVIGGYVEVADEAEAQKIREVLEEDGISAVEKDNDFRVTHRETNDWVGEHY